MSKPDNLRCNEPCNESLQDCNETYHREDKSRIDKNRVEEDTTSATSINQTGSASSSKIWSEVTGMVAIPGGQVDKVLPALDALKRKFPRR